MSIPGSSLHSSMAAAVLFYWLTIANDTLSPKQGQTLITLILVRPQFDISEVAGPQPVRIAGRWPCDVIQLFAVRLAHARWCLWTAMHYAICKHGSDALCAVGTLIVVGCDRLQHFQTRLLLLLHNSQPATASPARSEDNIKFPHWRCIKFRNIQEDQMKAAAC